MMRHFLGWDRPLLPSVVEWLIEHPDRSGGVDAPIDLGEVLVVLPGRRAGRRLSELLLASAAEHGAAIIPPATCTAGDLSDRLVRRCGPAPDPLHLRLLMAAAVREIVASDEGAEALIPRRSEPGDLAGWLALGDLVMGVHADLAAGGWSADPGTWPEAALALLPPDAPHRWAVVSAIIARLGELVEAAGFEEPQSRVLGALDDAAAMGSEGRMIVLAGTTWLPGLHRRLLEVAEDRLEVSLVALVHAPASMAETEAFDALGCVTEDYWAKAPLPLEEACIEVRGGPVDQARGVTGALAAWGDRYAPDEITVCLGDPQAATLMSLELAAHEVGSRVVDGTPIARTPLPQLLSAVAVFLEERSFRTYASLLRHPALAAPLACDDDLLALLDRYHSKHLPGTVPGAWRHAPKGRDRITREEADRLAALHRRLGNLLGVLVEPGVRPAAAWMEPIRGLIERVEGDAVLDRRNPDDHARITALERIAGVLQRLDELTPVAADMVGDLTAAKVLELVQSAVAGAVRPPASPGAVELVNWHDLLLDDAPAIVVMGLNEGLVPQVQRGDAFLPDALRQRLGLDHAEARAARDHHALRSLVESRRDGGAVHLVVGRRNAAGDPMPPSRLLLALDDHEVLAHRVRRLTRDPDTVTADPRLETAAVGAGLPVPRPGDEPAIERLSITDFGAYLACPYRFWLSRVRGLETVDDAAVELAPAPFGSFAHAVLEDFGNDADLVAQRDPDRMAEVLGDLLDQRVEARFGEEMLPGVRVQAEQLRARLRTFAAVQVAWAQQGWRILHTERYVRGVPFEVDGTPFQLTGRIDRIDRHEDTGELAVLDYKTGSTDPEKSHRVSSGWTNLQLPLYRHLVTSIVRPPSPGVKLGYFMLGPDPDRAGVVLADWTDVDLAEADEVARDVVRRVRRGEFWPPVDPPPRFAEPFQWICQDHGHAGALQDERVRS